MTPPPASSLEEETIVAIATPVGTGAVSLIRLSGAKSSAIVGKLLGLNEASTKQKLLPRKATLCTLKTPATATQPAEVLDQVLATRFAAPASFTGEEVIELACHGGVIVTQAVLKALLKQGARSAAAGEFTRRAFTNGKLDLTQAEAIMDLISARSELASKAAQNQLEGRLGKAILALKTQLLETVVHLEAWIDFPEEDISPSSRQELLSKLEQIATTTDQLLATGWQGRMLREGARVVLSGKPNAGKSSILNVLSGFDRAIVSKTAGTTRDTLEEWLDLNGIPIRLIDTAGLRDNAENAIEAEGIKRTQAEWEKADLVIEIVDGSQAGTTDKALQQKREELGFCYLLVCNKADLGLHSCWQNNNNLHFSALLDSPDPLANAICKALQFNPSQSAENLLSVNARHQAELQRARSFVQAACLALKANTEPDFIALELREAMEALGEIVGKVDVEEILGEIFATFCIGK